MFFPFDRPGTMGRKSALAWAWHCPVMVVFRPHADLKRYGHGIANIFGVSPAEAVLR
jgi:hypothetical protein